MKFLPREDDPEYGIAFSRIGLAAGVIVSVAGNVANTIYLTDHADVAWRIPGAVVWPPFLFLGIEIMVRNRHRKAFTGYLARLLLMLVSVATFITSYTNLHAFMIKTDEPWLATFAGPVGIDGLMLGSTLMLLAASMKAAVTDRRLSMVLQYAKPIGPMPAPAPMPAALPLTPATLTLAELEQDFHALNDVRPVSAPPRTRALRAQWDAALVTELAVDAVRAVDAHEKAGIGISTYNRYLKVARMLKANPTQNIDVKAEKVPAEHVEMMRKLVRR